MEQLHEQSKAWFITRRWQSYEGEVRAAVLRVALVALFYGLQLVHYFFFAARSEVEVLFHRQATWLAAGYLCVSLAVLVALRQRFFPAGLPFVTCGFDLCLLTVAAVMGSGPDSPLVAGYFVILAMAGLRFSLRVVWLATLGSIGGYLCLVGVVDPGWFDPEHTTPVVQQLVTIAALAATGLAIGQTIRMSRAAAESYAARFARLQPASDGGDAPAPPAPQRPASDEDPAR